MDQVTPLESSYLTEGNKETLLLTAAHCWAADPDIDVKSVRIISCLLIMISAQHNITDFFVANIWFVEVIFVLTSKDLVYIYPALVAPLLCGR